MKSFDEKASESTAQDIRAAADSRGRYKVIAEGLIPAENIGTDEFPQYGDWLEVKPLDGGPESELVDETYIEVPGQLAKWCAANEISVGSGIDIKSVRKDAGGRWSYSVEHFEPTD